MLNYYSSFANSFILTILFFSFLLLLKPHNKVQARLLSHTCPRTHSHHLHIITTHNLTMLPLIPLNRSIRPVNQGNRMAIVEIPNLTTLSNKGNKDFIRLGMLPTEMDPHHVVTEVDEEVGEVVLVILLLECW